MRRRAGWPNIAEDIGADGRFVAVAGDSAGGNLAAVVALDGQGPWRAGDLLSVADLSGDDDGRAAIRSPRIRDNAEGYLLTKAGMEWFWDHYLASPEDGKNPYASPLQASDLRGLPPAMVITAEFDPLRDEGQAYAKRLADAGVNVKTSHYEGLIHGFFWMAGALDAGKQLIAEIGSELRKQAAA